MKDEIKEKIKAYYLGDDIDEVLDCITNLQEKVDQYENPDDMTLMFMWCDEKAKDKIKQLKEERKTLYKYTPEKGFRLAGDEE